MTAARVVEADFSSLVDALVEMGERAADLSGPMAVVADFLVAAVDDKFEAGGPGWQPLAKSTIASRRGDIAQILVDDGILRGSIRGASGPDYAEAATGIAYAVFHVSDEPRDIIPKRDFMDLGDDVFEQATELLLEELTR